MYVAWRNYILKLYFILIILVCFSVWQVWFISTGFGLVSYDTVCTNTAVKGSPYISEEFSICNHFRTHDSTPSMCTLRHYTHTGACAPYTHCIQTVHTHARMHTRVHTRTHTHAHTRTHMCTRTHMYTHVRMHTQTLPGALSWIKRTNMIWRKQAVRTDVNIGDRNPSIWLVKVLFLRWLLPFAFTVPSLVLISINHLNADQHLLS